MHILLVSFLFLFSPHILLKFFTENFIKITVPSKCIHMLNLQHQVLFALICSTTMHRSELRHVKRRTCENATYKEALDHRGYKGTAAEEDIRLYYDGYNFTTHLQRRI